MSLQFTRQEFQLCKYCENLPGAATLCVECLERRELWDLVAHYRKQGRKKAQICQKCLGTPHIECPEHGR